MKRARTLAAIILLCNCAVAVGQRFRAGEPSEGPDPPPENIVPQYHPEPVTPPSVGAGSSSGGSGSTSGKSENSGEDILEHLADVIKDTIEKVNDYLDSLSSSSSNRPQLASTAGSTPSKSSGASTTSTRTATSQSQSQSAFSTTSRTTSSLTATTPPTITGDATGCLSVQSVYASCSQAASDACRGGAVEDINCLLSNPGFDSRPHSSQASCLCYSGNSFNASRYDGWVSQCHNYLATASLPATTNISSGATFQATQAAAFISGELGLCSNAGDVKSTSTPASTPSATGSMTGAGSTNRPVFASIPLLFVLLLAILSMLVIF